MIDNYHPIFFQKRMCLVSLVCSLNTYNMRIQKLEGATVGIFLHVFSSIGLIEIACKKFNVITSKSRFANNKSEFRFRECRDVLIDSFVRVVGTLLVFSNYCSKTASVQMFIGFSENFFTKTRRPSHHSGSKRVALIFLF